MTCPHCGSGPLDPGATGLDLCESCGGLSREGKALDRRLPYANFEEPVVSDLRILPASGVVVAAGYSDGKSRVFFFFSVGNKMMPPISLPIEQAEALPKLVEDALASLQRGVN